MTALAKNPLTTLCLITAIAYFFASLVIVTFDLPRVSFILADKDRNIMRAVVVTIFITQWAYLIILF
jgi:hypothetical protein